MQLRFYNTYNMSFNWSRVISSHGGENNFGYQPLSYQNIRRTKVKTNLQLSKAQHCVLAFKNRPKTFKHTSDSQFKTLWNPPNGWNTRDIFDKIGMITDVNMPISPLEGKYKIWSTLYWNWHLERTYSEVSDTCQIPTLRWLKYLKISNYINKGRNPQIKRLLTPLFSPNNSKNEIGKSATLKEIRSRRINHQLNDVSDTHSQSL